MTPASATPPGGVTISIAEVNGPIRLKEER
jgi:hypothetical protein